MNEKQINELKKSKIKLVEKVHELQKQAKSYKSKFEMLLVVNLFILIFAGIYYFIR